MATPFRTELCTKLNLVLSVWHVSSRVTIKVGLSYVSVQVISRDARYETFTGRLAVITVIELHPKFYSFY